jgi:hypothetical protein
MGAEFFYEDRRKDGRDNADSRVSRSSTKAYKIKRRKTLFISFLFVQFYRCLILAVYRNSNTSVKNGKVESPFQQ